MTDYPIKWHKTSHGYDKDMQPIRKRESFILIFETGAIEGWRTPSVADPVFIRSGFYGGIEVHSKTPQYDGHEKSRDYCEWTQGDCYHDGSSLAFDEIEGQFNNPAYIFYVLAEWAEGRLSQPDTGAEVSS